MPLGMADIADVLFREFLKCHPLVPQWVNRDRFVLSNGHGSALLYVMLYLSGYDVYVDDLKAFRELGSNTPGHPERGCLPGVEVTTGPLGQGIANAVGMALAEQRAAGRFNRPDCAVIDHRTWAFAGDGCVMEGVAHEAIPLAGVHGLHKLTVIYDSNDISIDGDIAGWLGDDVPARYEAAGWHVVRGVDGHDADAIRAGLQSAIAETARPTLVECRTVIGRGVDALQGSADVHGAALPDDAFTQLLSALGISGDPFDVPADVRAEFCLKSKGAAAYQKWQQVHAMLAEKDPSAHDLLQCMVGGPDVQRVGSIVRAVASKTHEASRKTSARVLDEVAQAMPEVMFGSADLSASTGMPVKYTTPVGSAAPPSGAEFIHFGPREHGMGSIANGIAAHGLLRPVVSTFMIFIDYALPVLRVASLSNLPVCWVLTHDSIGVGEDGPTHQPIEQLAMLRGIPGVHVWRPANVEEVQEAWLAALTSTQRPHVIVLSRQGFEQIAVTGEAIGTAAQGGWSPHPGDEDVDAVLVSSGSEVALTMQVAALAHASNIKTRIVSVPNLRLFQQQDPDYMSRVILPGKPRLIIEAATSSAMAGLVNADTRVLGIDRFGMSGPIDQVYEALGMTAENGLKVLKSLVDKQA